MSDGTVSFIIPAYNAAGNIGMCIDSVLAQRIRKEVIVVDDGSTDGTAGIMKKYGKRVRYVRQENSGPASARNRGLRMSKGSYVAFVDSDVVLPPGWAREALRLLGPKGIAGAGGPGRSPDRSMVSRALDGLLMGETCPSEDRLIGSVATMDIMYKKGAIKGMSFDESFRSASGEDPDFNFRLMKKGYKLVYSPRLWVHHRHPMTLAGVLRKWYNYGKHYNQLYSKHKDLRGPGYYARVSYMPLLIAFILLSFVNAAFALLALAQVLLLFMLYVKKGIEIRAGLMIIPFSAIHTLKQLAQLTGTLMGMKKRGGGS
ncbi:MAG: glycosyltransferase [Candidatus Aenigmarchaeota archaeon]|nr:glycosyltransferase [Candidatus Aenigmarchaeota archaeon]